MLRNVEPGDQVAIKHKIYKANAGQHLDPVQRPQFGSKSSSKLPNSMVPKSPQWIERNPRHWQFPCQPGMDGAWFNWARFLETPFRIYSDFPPAYIVLHADDGHKLELLCWPSFLPKYSWDILKHSLSPEIQKVCRPREWHLAVHGRVDGNTCSCETSREPIIQLQPDSSTKPNIFNSIYWPSDDCTYHNALGDKLSGTEGYAPKTHCPKEWQLKDVVIPRPEIPNDSPWEEVSELYIDRLGYRPEHQILCREPEQAKSRFVEDLKTYEKFKDCFVERIG